MKVGMINGSVAAVLFVSLVIVIMLTVLHRLLCAHPDENVSKVEVLCRFSPETFQTQAVAPLTNCHCIISRESVIVTNWVYGTRAKRVTDQSR